MQSALTFLAIIIGPVVALVIVAAIIERRRSKREIDPNRGGLPQYCYGDRVWVTHGGHRREGVFKGLGPRIAGQPDQLRMASVLVEWVDDVGQSYEQNVAMPYWRIRGKVVQQKQKRKMNKKNVWDTTARLFAVERWVR